MSVTQITDGTNILAITAGSAIKVDGSATTQPVSGTVTITPSGTQAANITQISGSSVSTAATGIIKVGISDSSGTSIALGQTTMSASVPVVIASNQSNITTNNGTVSTNNSSTATLAANAVFTGTADDTTNYNYVLVQAYSNVASANGGVSLQFSPDNTNWDNQIDYTATAASAFTIELAPTARYFRIVYTNGATIQTSFRLQTVYKTTAANNSGPAGQQPTSNNTLGALYVQGVTSGTPITIQPYEPAVVTGTITSASSTITATTGATTCAVVTVHGTYAGVNFAFQASDDSGTTYYPILATRSDESGAETTTGVLTANTSRMWTVYYNNVTNLQVATSAWTSGTANIRISMTTEASQSAVITNQPTAANLNATVVQATASNLNAQVVGSVASGSADSGNPVKTGGVATIATLPTAVTSGQRTNFMTDKLGRLCVTTNSVRAQTVVGNQTLTTTTAVNLLDAQGAGIFADMTSLIISSSANTVTNCIISDGTHTYTFPLGRLTSGAGIWYDFSFVPPLPAMSANTAWQANLSAAVTDVYVIAVFVLNT